MVVGASRRSERRGLRSFTTWPPTRSPETDVAGSEPRVVADLQARLAEHLREHGGGDDLIACWTDPG